MYKSKARIVPESPKIVAVRSHACHNILPFRAVIFVGYSLRNVKTLDAI